MFSVGSNIWNTLKMLSGHLQYFLHKVMQIVKPIFLKLHFQTMCFLTKHSLDVKSKKLITKEFKLDYDKRMILEEGERIIDTLPWGYWSMKTKYYIYLVITMFYHLLCILYIFYICPTGTWLPIKYFLTLLYSKYSHVIKILISIIIILWDISELNHYKIFII